MGNGARGLTDTLSATPSAVPLSDEEYNKRLKEMLPDHKQLLPGDRH